MTTQSSLEAAASGVTQDEVVSVSLFQRPWPSVSVHAITIRLNRNPFISPLPARGIGLYALMGTRSYHPKDRR